jgi:subtilase family serine protease
MRILRYQTALGPILALLLCLTVSSAAFAQTAWVSTATKAYPVQYLSNATLLGPLDPSTSLHIVVGLQEQNADQVQPTLLRMITLGDPLYGTSLTVQQFVAQFGPTPAQVQAVQTYLSGNGLANITVADNQLLIEADGTAAAVTAAFNTALVSYSVNEASVYVNIADAQVPASLAGVVVAVLGLNNVVAVHFDAHTLALNTSPATDSCSPPNCPTPAIANEVYGPRQYQSSSPAVPARRGKGFFSAAGRPRSWSEGAELMAALQSFDVPRIGLQSFQSPRRRI